MKVFFIGAGPGASDLITIRGANRLASSPLVLYAGSLVPKEMLVHCRPDAQIVNTALLNLDEQEEFYKQAKAKDLDVARLHSGDPSIYGATSEQMRRLENLKIEYEIVPGVSSFSAAAAAVGKELTAPGISQTIILTRVSGRASTVPEAESLRLLASHKATLCIFLSGPQLKSIVEDLLQFYRNETPVALVRRASWPDESRHCSTLGQVLAEVDINDWRLTTILLVGDVLSPEITAQSQLYSPAYSHLFRKGSTVQEST
ncbi:precorrin-4 C(11)-methyltransferase [soil metagenome]